MKLCLTPLCLTVAPAITTAMMLSACSSNGVPADPLATGGVEPSGGTEPGTGGADGTGAMPAVASGGTGGTEPSGNEPWPEAKLAAVSLSYDDGLDSQLKYAVPALANRGFHATFYLASFPGLQHEWALPDLTSELSPRHQAWAGVAAQGHELGGHTIHHPCASNGAGFQPKDYNSARMAGELDQSNQRLLRLGAEAPYTFAYPCGGDVAGISDGSYMDLVNERYLAARTSSIGVSVPGSVDLHDVAQKFGDYEEGATAAELIAYVDEALAQGGWAVFTFHGIGENKLDCDINEFDLDACALSYLSTSNEAHEALLDYLASKQSEVWVAPVKEVATYLSN